MKIFFFVMLLVLAACQQQEIGVHDLAQAYCDGSATVMVSECSNYIRVIHEAEGRGSTIIVADGTEIICPVIAPTEMSDECKEILLEPQCEEKQVC